MCQQYTTGFGLRNRWMLRACLALGSVLCLAVSGCQSLRPAVSNGVCQRGMGDAIDDWSASSMLNRQSGQSVVHAVAQKNHESAQGTLSLVSHSTMNVTVAAAEMVDSCPSCQPRCSMGWCMSTKLCCLDNPCQMPPHYAYAPMCHGYTQFAPYNHTTVAHQGNARHHNQDPRQPYESDVFARAYENVVGDRESGAAGEDVFEKPEGLPNLLDVVPRR